MVAGNQTWGPLQNHSLMWMGILSACIPVHHLCVVLWGPEEGLRPLEQELQTYRPLLVAMWMLGLRLGFSGRTAGALTVEISLESQYLFITAMPCLQ